MAECVAARRKTNFILTKNTIKIEKISKIIGIFTCIIKGLIKVLTEVREKCYTLVIKKPQFRGLNCREKIKVMEVAV